MTKRALFSTLVLLVLSLAGPAVSAASAAPQISSFSLSPSCVAPGGTVTGTATIHNPDLWFYAAYGQARASYFGVTVQTSSVSGPYPLLPFLSESGSVASSIPWYAPWGQYTVTFGIGPSPSSLTAWGTRSATLTVSPFC
jgi:hypothetical protein